jgi:beta-lactam-binding protein with PASTA domain
MSSFTAFLKSRQFFIHLGTILLLIVLVFFFTLRYLSSYSNHGEYVVVPDFRGKSLASLPEFTVGKDVGYQIIDSIYDPREKPGTVLRQDPEVNVRVKHNRTVYLYVTGMVPPQIQMPKLIDRSERQARLILRQYGLREGRIEERHSDCNGCVVEQLINGRPVAQGVPIKKGSRVDLVIGRKDAFYGAAQDSLLPAEEEPDFDKE